MSLLVLLIPFLVASTIAAENGPIARTSYGAVEGVTETLTDESTVNVFLGIPFAEPPVGDLRLEKPHPPKPWHAILAAKSYPAACPPLTRKFLNQIGPKVDEDCLYLNVIAPSTPSDDPNGYPVLVWIHGGAFSFGSTTEYGHAVLAEQFVKRGIVVVMIQYRVGALGFAANNDADFAGNYGLWDQHAALLFVKDNIGAFGGNPAKTTVWGESAGSASVSSLTLSTHSKDLFAQAIQNSGSAYGEWSHSNLSIKYTTDYAQYFNCPLNNVKACFKKLTLDQLLDAGDHFGKPFGFEHRLFGPRPDGDFFEKPLDQLIVEVDPKPSIIGFASHEFLIFAVIEDFLSKLPTFNEQTFVENVHKLVPSKVFGLKTADVRQKIVDFYLKIDATETTVKDNVFYYTKCVDLGSDVFFNVPILSELQAKTDANWPLYTYLTTYSNEGTFPDESPLKKATHLYELFYIFNSTYVLPFDGDEKDAEFSRILFETMTAFVKNGDPSIDNVSWPAMTKSEYLELKPFTPEVKHGLFQDRLQFWTKLANDYKFDIIRGIHKAVLTVKDDL